MRVWVPGMREHWGWFEVSKCGVHRVGWEQCKVVVIKVYE